jgi:FtsZ-interacting cell division protein ZipA
MDPFAIVMLILIGLGIAWLLVLGFGSSRRATAIIGRPERRARGMTRQAQVENTTVYDTMAGENARRRREGRPELSVAEMESRAAADARARERETQITEENRARQRGRRPRLTHREAGRAVDSRRRGQPSGG